MRLYWFSNDDSVGMLETKGCPPNIGTTLYLRSTDSTKESPIKFKVVGVDRVIRQIPHIIDPSKLPDGDLSERFDAALVLAKEETGGFPQQFDFENKRVICNIDCAEITMEREKK